MILIFPLWIFHLHVYVEKIPAASALATSASLRRYNIRLIAAKSNNLKFYNPWFDPTDEPMINYVNHNNPNADDIYFLFQLQFKYSSA